jgi:hypothetical protein
MKKDRLRLKIETMELIKKMEDFIEEVSKSPERSREFLQKTGIYTPKGNLRKPYK